MAAPSSEPDMLNCQMRQGKVMRLTPLASDRAGLILSVLLGKNMEKYPTLSLTIINTKSGKMVPWAGLHSL